MSQRILTVPRLNYVSNFNFFFTNTKKNLLIEQNFIGNQFLTSTYRKFITSPRNQTPHFVKTPASPIVLTYPLGESKPDFALHEVATKVLTCQDSDLPRAMAPSFEEQAHLKTTTNHIPFEVNEKLTKDQVTSLLDVTSAADLKALVNPYIKLTKPNLTTLVTLSCICSYAISPYSVSIPELVFLTVGTTLCSGAANAINMGREPEFDRKMARTSTRPVVRGLVTPKQLFQFAAVTGAVGCTMLYLGVNPIVSALGFANIVLYAWIYTSLKRKSIINTWVGAIVGAIPPLMGWAAASPISHPGALCLAGLLFAWQFPHFNALSHNVAQQYKNAGYVMTAAENPRLNARVALRYSILMFPLCFGLSYYGVTDWVFQFDSAIANGWLTYLAYAFWRQQEKNYGGGRKPTPEGLTAAGFHAKKLFWCSVWQLPAILVLAMLHKKGQWDRLFSYLGFETKGSHHPKTIESL